MRDKPLVFLPLVGAVFLAIGLFLGARFFGGRSLSSPTFGGKSGLYQEILKHIESSYVDDVNIDSLRNFGIEKMLEKLDPHTAYIPAVEQEIVTSDLDESFDGIGVEFNIFNDSLHVISALSGGPSEAVGIKSGDIILMADSTKLVGKDLSSFKVMKSLRGPKGSSVKLNVYRKSYKKILVFNVKRDKIPTFSIDAAFLIPEKKVGFIKVNRFAESTYDEFKMHLDALIKQGMKSLILDLRSNPGGYMDRATDIVDELVAGTDKIVYTKGREKSNNYEIKAGRKGSFEVGKIIVLVDEGSASASEIVSGALQDFDRAVIIGRRTFGKGLVQAPIRLSDGSELRLTISRYYIPSGRSIQKPYEKGNTIDYIMEVGHRYDKKEVFSKDSISTKGLPKFKTKSGRTVFGGGGITPDIFIPQDTSFYSPLLFEVFSKNALRDFSNNFAISYGSEIKKVGFEVFKNGSHDAALEKTFRVYLKNNMAKFSEKDYFKSRNYLISNAKATLARNLWKEKENKGLSNEYYQVLFSDDKMIKMALKNL
jgi:carboxyl-terminal processing protease